MFIRREQLTFRINKFFAAILFIKFKLVGKVTGVHQSP